MAFLWIIADKNGNELNKTYLLQFFPKDTKYPIGKSMAAEIMGVYELERVDMGKGMEELKGAYDILVKKIKGENIYLIFEGASKEGDTPCMLRFSEGGADIYIDPEFVYVLQNACRLELAHPKDIEYKSPMMRIYRVLQKRNACYRVV
jgi:hypothetical protein